MQRTMNIDGQKMTVRIRRRHSRGNPIGWIAKIGKATYFFNVLDPQEAMDKAVAKYHAAIGAQAVLTIDEANAIAASRAVVSADPVDASLWLVEGDGWTESHEPMGRADWLRFLDGQCDHDGSGTGEGVRTRAQVEKDKRDPEPRCWNCDAVITHEQAHRNGTLCDKCKAAQPQVGIDEEITQIARRELGIETLEPRKRDALDFHEVSVWQIKAALAAAFELGRKTR